MAESKKHCHQYMYRRAPVAATGQRRREETSIRIRKQKREQRLQKRRQTSTGLDLAHVTAPKDLPALQELTQTLQTGSEAQRYVAAQQIRKLLSGEHPPIDAVMQMGVVPFFVQLLAPGNHANIQFEAAWVLTNLASGHTTHTRTVVNAGAMEALVPLIDSSNEDVRGQAMWALSNLTGDCVEFRDRALGLNVVSALLRNFRPKKQGASLTNTTAWLMSNLCRGKPAPPFHIVRPLIGALAWLIQQSDEEALADTCWTLSYLTEGSDASVDAVVDAGISIRLVQLMNHPASTVHTPSVRAVGNILAGADYPTQTMIDSGAVPTLIRLLDHHKRAIKREACWGLSNVAAGSKPQVDRLIVAGALPKVVNLLSSSEFAVKREAAWVIGNATAIKDAAQIQQIVSSGALPPMVEIMTSQDVKLIRVVLETLENVLEVGQRAQRAQGLAENPYTEVIESAGALDHLETLQDHEDESIYQQAVALLERYFQSDISDEPAPTPTQAVFDFSSGFS